MALRQVRVSTEGPRWVLAGRGRPVASRLSRRARPGRPVCGNQVSHFVEDPQAEGVHCTSKNTNARYAKTERTTCDLDAKAKER